MDNIIQKTKAKNLHLKEGEIVGLFYLLLKEAPFTNTAFIQLTGLPKETLRQFKASIGEFLDDPKGDEVVLNDLGIKHLSALDLKPYSWSLLVLDNDSLEKQLIKIREKYSLNPKRDYDQFFATEKTSVAKAQLLLQKDSLQNKKIALLGDDDFVSIVLGLSNVSYSEITIFDIDRKLLNTLKKIVEELSLKNINFEYYDARNELKPAFLRKYDIVVTDPPYTKSGIELFLTRATQLLKEEINDLGNYIYLYYGNSYRDSSKELKIQEVIQKSNFIIEDKINKFARYNGADSIGNASSVYILRNTKHTRVVDSYLDTEIYTFENTSEENFPYVDHFVFKLFKVPSSLLTSKKGLQKALGDFCRWHKLNVVDQKITRFKGGGFTITYVLSQSNLVAHTWPENNALHIDLITCSPIAKKERFAENLSQLFQTKYLEIVDIE